MAALVSGGTGAAGTGPATGTVELTRPAKRFNDDIQWACFPFT